MKTTFFFLLLWCSTQAHAKNYYFSSTVGDDTRSATDAQNPQTPWRSIQKLNTIFSGLVPGDSIFFRRNETFYGSINVAISGSATSPVVLSAYGEGVRPVITGFDQMSGWVEKGNNIWEATIPKPVSRLNLLTINGRAAGMGRYPNYSDPNQGYRTIDAHNGTLSITDNNLSSTIDWTNAEVVIRKNRWELERGTITQHTGTLLKISTPTNFEPENKFGYFIQNHLGTLDQTGEWFHDPLTNKVSVYVANLNPNTIGINVPTINELIVVQGRSNIVFENLSFQGANGRMFLIQHSRDLVIRNCTIKYSAFDAIYCENVSNFNTENNAIEESNNSGFVCYSCHNLKLTGNSIKNIGTKPGMARPQGLYTAISITGSNYSVSSNMIDSVGYVPIDFNGDSVLIKNNVINYFGFVKDDGGGIYTWNGFTPLRTYKKRQIIGNIILNGIGAGPGTNSSDYKAMHGIYLDDKTGTVDVHNNTVAYCGLSGIYVHNSFALSILNNNLYCNEKQLIMTSDEYSGGVLIRDVYMKENVLFSKNSNQYVAYSTTNYNDLSSMGLFDRNYYCRPADDNLTFYTSYQNGGSRISGENNLFQWQSLVNQDFNSRRTPFINPSFSVSGIKRDKFMNESFAENTQEVSVWSQAQNCIISRVGSKISGGTLQVSFNQLIDAKNTAYIMFRIGAVEAGKTYQVRFDVQNGITGKNAKMFIRKQDAPYNTISNLANVTLPDTIANKRLIFTAQNTESNAYLILEVNEQPQPLWIDNFQVNEADVNAITPDSYVKFFYNPTPAKQTYSLDTLYSDMKGVWHKGTVELEPFSSVVLMKPYGYTVLPFYFADVDLNSSTIRWKVAFESGITRYEVQGSTDGKTFHYIGNVPPSAKAVHDWYNFNLTGSPFSLFRIKAVDQDQNPRYSKILKAQVKENFSFLINNPVINLLEVSLKAGIPENTTINIYSVSGNLLKSSVLKKMQSRAVVDVSFLAQGTYVVSVQSPNSAASRLFLKN